MTRRGAGICLPLTALPGPNGVGELGIHARRFVDSLAAMGVNTWQILPLGPTAYGNSPYQPLSAFAGNPLLIDLDLLTQAGWVSANELKPFSRLPSAHVDYGSLIPLKLATLRKAADRFLTSPTSTQDSSFSTFLARHDEAWLDEYAVYQVLKDLHGQLPWHQWDLAYRTRDRKALAAPGASATGANWLSSRSPVLVFHSMARPPAPRGEPWRGAVRRCADLHRAGQRRGVVAPGSAAA